MLLFVSLCACTLLACSDDDDNDNLIGYDALPEISRNFVQTYFGDQDVVYVTRDKDSYDVMLAGGYKVEFDLTGNWEEVDGPLAATLPNQDFIPQKIRDYVSQNFEVGINSISRNAVGYEVELINSIELQFDSEGNFVRIDT